MEWSLAQRERERSFVCLPKRFWRGSNRKSERICKWMKRYGCGMEQDGILIGWEINMSLLGFCASISSPNKFFLFRFLSYHFWVSKFCETDPCPKIIHGRVSRLLPCWPWIRINSAENCYRSSNFYYKIC